jgi:hypothetical protein
MSEASSGRERRVFGRRRSRIHALLLVPGRPPSPCVIRNYSRLGAMLELSELLEPPFAVRLRLFDTGNEFDCEVRYVKQYRLGVQFLAAEAGEIVAMIAGEMRRRQSTVICEPMITPRPQSVVDLRRRVLGIG